MCHSSNTSWVKKFITFYHDNALFSLNFTSVSTFWKWEDRVSTYSKTDDIFLFVLPLHPYQFGESSSIHSPKFSSCAFRMGIWNENHVLGPIFALVRYYSLVSKHFKMMDVVWKASEWLGVRNDLAIPIPPPKWSYHLN